VLRSTMLSITERMTLFYSGCEPAGGFELKPKVVIGAALVLLEKEHIRAHAERHGELADGVEGGLGIAALVAPNLEMCMPTATRS
jgi:hypothetical protein